ncbi:cobalamin biosynthesis protein [Chloroflexota bacterium]
MEIILILVLAFALDLALGDPPNAVHPVAWLGKIISFLEKQGIKKGAKFQFLYGVGMTVFLVAHFAVPVYYLLVYLQSWNAIVYVILGALGLKLSFSFRGLREAALKVKRLLQEDKTEAARFEMRALVSRNTEKLPEPMLVSAVVESVAEGICDSIVAPLFYFLLFGILGAIGYRVVNTMDAMIGYHGKYEYLGKFASWLDDVLNYIPARISVLLLVVASYFSGKNGKAAWQVAFHEHSRTESPNAGWTIAAMAGALDVRLEKVGQYRLGIPNTALLPARINDAVKLLRMTVLIWFLFCLMIGVIYIVAGT